MSGALAIWWFAAGSSFVTFIDALSTTADEPSAPKQFTFYEGEQGLSGSAKFTFGDRERRAGDDWRIIEHDGRVSLETPKGKFLLGVVTRWSMMGKGRRSYTFAPEPGDSVSLTRRRSRLSWPRPFEIAWLGGRLPFWGRHVYDRLVWRKVNGEELDIEWRDEQLFEPSSDAWMDQYNSAEPRTSIGR